MKSDTDRSDPGRGVHAVLPAAVLLVYAALLAHPGSRDFAVAMVQENRPVELLTFAFLMAAGVLAFRVARRMRERGKVPLVWLFHQAFGLAMIFIAMEEIAWGQHFLGFETPDRLEEINQQGETTLHNIGRLQGRSEVFRLVFGFAGLVGIWLYYQPPFTDIGVTPSLWPWFAVIALAAAIDLHHDYFPVGTGFYDQGWRWLSEVVEMLIGAAALLYVREKVAARAPAPVGQRA